MRDNGKSTGNITVFGLFFIFFVCNLFLFAQTPEKERPKLKDFGSSLKRKDKKNTTVAAQKQKSDEETIKVKTDLVVNDVLVLDEKGFTVKGLTKDDFVIIENGEKQEVRFFALGSDAKVPRSIVLVIDHSVSEIPFIVSS